MALQLPTPQDPSQLMQDALRQRLAILSQPKGWSIMAPQLQSAIQNIGGGLNQAYANYDKKRSVAQAAQLLSDYYATPESERTPEMHRGAIQASLSMGLQPPEMRTKSLEQLMAESAAKAAGTAQGKPKENPEDKQKRIYSEAKARAAGTAAGKPQDSGNDLKLAKMWQTNINNILPAIAKRGSPLGIAAVNNQRKDRLLEMAKQTNLNPQQVRMMELDLAGVMQGGSPQEDTIRATHYGSIAQDWASFKGKITGTPQDANSPEIVAQLKKMAQEVGAVDNKVIADNLKTIEQYPSMTYLIKKDPKGWQNFKTTFMSTYLPQDSGTATPSSSSQSSADPLGIL